MQTSSTLDLDARRTLRLVQPRTERQLHAWVRLVLGFDMPHRPRVDGHQSPFAYLAHSFFEDRSPRDCVVWANRGGGKTQIGAIATLLDLLFKPGVQIRILGGSFEQSSKMYRYLRRLLEDDAFRDLTEGNATGRAVELVNGSRVEVLSQSERAVRGQRVHKLRCDEVELFDPDVWAAAQLVTRSGMCGDTFVRGSIETLSTMHRPYGLMQELVRDADSAQRKVFRWSVLDTLEHCPTTRDCATCPLWNDCQGRAKEGGGFLAIDDAIQQQRRVDPQTWSAEMLCERPSRSDAVYPDFDRAVHVQTFEPPLDDVMWIGGIDFGYRAPTVLLWAYVDDDNLLSIVDELVVREQIIERIIEYAAARDWPRPEWIGADPAGHQRNDQTGSSTITIWNKAGWPMRTQRVALETGVAAVAKRLRAADGAVRLRIHSRCEKLIEAMTQYHYPADQPDVSTPVKDGPDHAADALRYLVTNLDRRSGAVRVRGY